MTTAAVLRAGVDDCLIEGFTPCEQTKLVACCPPENNQTGRETNVGQARGSLKHVRLSEKTQATAFDTAPSAAPKDGLWKKICCWTFMLVSATLFLSLWDQAVVSLLDTGQSAVNTGCRGHRGLAERLTIKRKDTTVTGNDGRQRAAWNFGSRLRVKQRLPPRLRASISAQKRLVSVIGSASMTGGAMRTYTDICALLSCWLAVDRPVEITQAYLESLTLFLEVDSSHLISLV
ncbi:hypothetical protein CSAL01_07020 [Colletotrichum salicis]|uniref:Uncharacterized protein n=1 Tax=Colletotrichum salicis TaxID=1209931 RepID=A0A135THM1_9PEZI|nr:hypothetical protein CSAL01_07020 [Colletotrichum salicis]